MVRRTRSAPGPLRQRLQVDGGGPGGVLQRGAAGIVDGDLFRRLAARLSSRDHAAQLGMHVGRGYEAHGNRVMQLADLDAPAVRPVTTVPVARMRGLSGPRLGARDGVMDA